MASPDTKRRVRDENDLNEMDELLEVTADEKKIADQKTKE